MTFLFLVIIYKITILKIRTLPPLLHFYFFLRLIFKARMLSKHSWNGIYLKVGFNINLCLCIALYYKVTAPSCLQEELYLTWLGCWALCCGDASSATWAALPWLCSARGSFCCSLADSCCCPCTLLASQGCLVHGLFVKLQTEKVLSTPVPFAIDLSDSGRKNFELAFYVSIFMYVVNFENFLFCILLVSQ